ncbi:MAG: type II toxin-antitoxin system VapC family toxin, partial [Nitrospinae bacterium]|nr:type II toxin-antitoxin system VapC family toxin [Nitrospinota bacterium]
MRYLLDTNHCVYLMNGLEKKPAVRSKEEQQVIEAVERLGDDPLYMAPATLGELYYGAACSQRKKQNMDKIK